MAKTNPGNFFEDFQLGDVIEHATPRTIGEGDRALYRAIYPTRVARWPHQESAANVGLASAPPAQLIHFHVPLRNPVPHLSHNAVATLGYAQPPFHPPLLPGDP